MMYDFLGLKACNFREADLVVFSGISGSGKSTAIQFLIEHHQDFINTDYEIFEGSPVVLKEIKPQCTWLIIDEIRSILDLIEVAKLLRKGHRLIIASHVPTTWLSLFTPFWRIKLFKTDSEKEKLRHARVTRAESEVTSRQSALTCGTAKAPTNRCRT